MLIHIPFKAFFMLKVKFYTSTHLHYPTSDITIIGQLAFDVSKFVIRTKIFWILLTHLGFEILPLNSEDTKIVLAPPHGVFDLFLG